jgi:hypothetical protein
MKGEGKCGTHVSVLHRTRPRPLLSKFNAAAIKVSSDGLGLAKLRRYSLPPSQGREQ